MEDDEEEELARAIDEIRAEQHLSWTAMTGLQRWSLILSPLVAIGSLVMVTANPVPGLRFPFALLLVAAVLQFLLGLRQARRDQHPGG